MTTAYTLRTIDHVLACRRSYCRDGVLIRVPSRRDDLRDAVLAELAREGLEMLWAGYDADYGCRTYRVQPFGDE